MALNCPNVNSSEWKALVDSVGEKEAYRDFFETDNIRTPKEVIDKLNAREYKNVIESLNERTEQLEREQSGIDEIQSEAERLSGMDFNTLDILTSVETSENSDAIKFNDILSEKLGVEYEFLTSEEALALTKETTNPWSGEKSFFYKGKVYFVGKNMSTADVFHEYSHPVVTAIKQKNKPLYDSLLQQLRATETGQKIIDEVTERYKDISDVPEHIFDEAIVRALEYEFSNKSVEPGFKSFIKDLMFHIKQFFRSVFGKQINISKLSPSTTLKELASMIENGSDVNFELSNITHEDIVQYKRNMDDISRVITNTGNETIQQLTNILFEARRKTEVNISKPENIDLPTLILINQALGKGTTQDMYKNLSKYQNEAFIDMQQIIADGKSAQDMVMSDVKFMMQAERLVEDMVENLKQIKDDPNIREQDYVARIDYINKFLKPYKEMVDSALEMSDKMLGSGSKDSLTSLLHNIKNNLDASQRIINDSFNEGMSTVLYEQLEHSANKIKNYYEDMIKKLENQGAKPSVIDKYYKEYYGMTKEEWQRFSELDKKKGKLLGKEKLAHQSLERKYFEGMMLSKEKISRLLQGELMDAHWVSSNLEGYLYNTDPTISGFANYIRDQYSNMEAIMYRKMNDFYNDVFGDLKELGYNPRKIGEFAKKYLLARDKKFLKNYQTGEFEETVVYSFHDKTINARSDRSQLVYNRDEMFQRWVDAGSPQSGDVYNDFVQSTKDLQEHLDKYWNQQYTKEYIDFKNAYFSDDIGVVAEDRLNSIRSKIQHLNSLMSESDPIAFENELNALRRERKELYSEYSNGVKKTGLDLAIAKRLKEFRKKSRKFYDDPVYIEGSIEEKYFEFEEILNSQGLFNEGSTRDQFISAMHGMLSQYSTVKIKESYWNDRKNIIDQIEKLVGKGNEMSEDIKGFFDISSKYRDEDFQIAGNMLSNEERMTVKKLLERDSLNKAKDKLLKSGLSKTLNKADFQKLLDLFSELDALQTRDISDYFIDEFNSVLSNIDVDVKKELFDYLEEESGKRIGGIDRSMLESLLSEEGISYLEDIANNNEGFKEWFKHNFYEESYVEGKGKTKRVETRLTPLRTWYKITPSDAGYFEKHAIRNSNGDVVFIMDGVPSYEFYHPSEIKKQFKNDKIVGETVDNSGHWLPLSIEQSPHDDKYQNKEYYNLKENNKEVFRVLEKIKSHLLSYQEGLDNTGKVYYDLPRFQMDRFEMLTTSPTDAEGKHFSLFQRIIRRIKQFWESTAFDAEKGFNEDDLMQQITLDKFDPEDRRIPIHGLYNIPIEETSVDFVSSMMKYLQSAEKFKALNKISPMAHAFEETFKDPRNIPNRSNNHRRISLRRLGLFGLRKKSKDTYVREQAINNLIEREFYGVKTKGILSDNRLFQNAMGTMFGRASFAFFAFNIPSALKNAMNIKFNSIIEAASGDDMDLISRQKGGIWATRTMMELSSGELYQTGPSGLRNQIALTFDLAQGRAEEKFGTTMSRTFIRDAFGSTWTQNFRKWIELQATFQIGAGMLYSKKLTRYAGTPKEEVVSYMDAWELNADKNIQLKDGFDPEWGITYDENGVMKVGKEFRQFKKTIHQKNNNLQGAYAQFDQPNAQRYLLFRMVSFLRRYFTPMLINHYQFSGNIMSPKARVNWTTGRAERGFIIEGISAAKHVLLNRDFSGLSERQKRGFRKGATEAVLLYLTFALLKYGLGWDSDDEDKMKKVRARSGSLPTPFTKDDNQFNLGGYLHNHLIALLLKTNVESSEFALWRMPSTLYSYTSDLKPLATSSTVGVGLNLLDQAYMTATGDPRAEYTRDVGPYIWQKKGSNKAWARLFRAIGVTGTDVGVDQGIANIQRAESTRRVK